MRLPLFPLSSHLLPQGRLALRIFEPRYIRMVKEVCAVQSGFVICMINETGERALNTHIFPIGTYCKVIDFDILDDGLLGVTVEGHYCVSINNIETEHDGLRVGDCNEASIWQSKPPNNNIENINEKLREVFQQYPEVSELYDDVRFNEIEWVINRWLELLPVAAEQKQHFLKSGDTQKVFQYLNQLIKP